MKNPMKILMRIILLLLFLLNALSSLDAQETLYVKQNATGNNDGSSWFNAFIDLQDAIAEADSTTSIWVAEGNYLPTATEDRTISFVLKNGVKMYGGFVGTENDLSQRDFTNNLTTLNGNIGSLTDSTDNSYQVIYSIGTDSTARIDGFMIRNGHAFDPDISTSYNYGGGIYLAATEEHLLISPVIINNHFINNTARYYGGAIYCAFSDEGEAIPTISHCSFTNNEALLRGGAIYKEGNPIDSLPFLIYGCSFKDNETISKGADICLWEINGLNILDSCFFWGSDDASDGLVSFFSAIGNNGDLIINNCYFVQIGGNYIHSIIATVHNVDDRYINIDNCCFTGDGTETTTGPRGIRIQHYDADLMGSKLFFRLKNSSFVNVFTGPSGVVNFHGSNIKADINNCYFEGKYVIPPMNGKLYNAFDIGAGGQELELNVSNSIFHTINRALEFSFNNDSLATKQANFSNCTFYNVGNRLFDRRWEPGVFYDHHINVSNSIIMSEAPMHELFKNINNDNDSITFEGYNIHYCLVYSPDCLVNGEDACGPGMLYQLDPLFVDSMNGDFRLLACSPAINVGDNNSIDTSLIPYDYKGQLRILEDVVDLGAYEQFGTPTIESSIESVSSTGATDGSITIDSVYGGTSPYSYLWSTGDTVPSVDNLSVGIYTVTITDDIGCELVEAIEVGLFTNLSELISSESEITVYPNPTTGDVQYFLETELSGTVEINVYDLLGHSVFEYKKQIAGSYAGNLFLHVDGVYFIKVVFPDGAFKVMRIVVQ